MKAQTARIQTYLQLWGRMRVEGVIVRVLNELEQEVGIPAVKLG